MKQQNAAAFQNAPSSELHNGTNFCLNPAIDWAKAGEALAHCGRVSVPDLLRAGADQMLEFLRETDDLIQVINRPGDVLELRLDEWEEMDGRRKAAILRAMHRRASMGFQYSYSAIAIPDRKVMGRARGLIGDFARFMNSRALLDPIEDLLGCRDLRFTDGQATCYNRGDFLTGHDDAAPGRNRVAAFVLNLTPVWRLEWGGLLIFHPTATRPAQTLVPEFNTLNLFTVPQLHSVSMVTQAAMRSRFALTGWLSRASS